MNERWKAAAAGILSVGLATGAAAYTQLFRFQYCASVPDKSERLACYDNYARELGLNPGKSTDGVSATQKSQGKWTVRAESTRNANTVFVFTEGRTGFSHATPSLVPTIVSRCENRTTELFVSFGAYFPVEVGPEEKSVLYSRPAKSGGRDQVKPMAASIRFDGGKPQPVSLRRSVDGRSFFFPNPVSFIRQLRSHDKMDFRFESSGHPPMDTVFSLDGMDEALEPLRKQCEW